jgi:hypothetical protein
LCSPARVESSNMSSAQRSGVKGPPVIDLTDQRNDVVNLIDEDVNTYDREPMAGGTAVLGMKKRHSVVDVTVKQPQQKSSRKVTSKPTSKLDNEHGPPVQKRQPAPLVITDPLLKRMCEDSPLRRALWTTWATLDETHYVFDEGKRHELLKRKIEDVRINR